MAIHRRAMIERVDARVAELRRMRDQHGWPEPRTVEDLVGDPRVQLRNRVGLRLTQDANDLELAAALILLVAEDMRVGGDVSGLGQGGVGGGGGTPSRDVGGPPEGGG